MLWSRKKKAHEPFGDPDWNLVTTTDFFILGAYPRLVCPDNIYWDLLYLNFMIAPPGGVNPYIWLWDEANDYHLWTSASVSTLAGGSTYHVCASQNFQGIRGGANHEVMTVQLPQPCYMRPRDRLTIYHLPYSSSTVVSRIIATAREWRIY